MRRDRMETLVHVRELVERRRLAEQAEARREHDVAERAHHAARAALAGASFRPGTTVLPLGLAAHHAGAVALGEALDHATQTARMAERRHEQAQQRWSKAAMERKAAERLAERRAELLAAEEDKRERRQLDEVALTVWRRAR
jgi:flagellar export protein FliJ